METDARRARSVPRLVAAVVVAVAAVATGCSTPPSEPVQAPSTSSAAPPTASSSSTAGAPSPTPSVSGTVTGLSQPAVLADRLEVPWGVSFLPDGSALVAERRSGAVVRVTPEGATASAGRVPGVADQGEGGLLGLAVLDEGRTVVAYLTSTSGDNRVVSMPYRAGTLGDPTVLLDSIPSGATHNGGRVVVGPDGNLWIGTGDAGDRGRAQDTGSRGGKILRIAPDGTIPADNPFPGSPVWSYGHRNVQGLAFDSSGQLWATEFGQNSYDELNRIERGGNHGWPLVEGRGGDSRFVDPVVTWRTEDASPSGLAIIDDVAYVGALRGQRVWQVPLTGATAGDPVGALEGDFGRLRTVVAAPDGSLWLTTSNRDGRGDPVAEDDRVLRVTIT